MRVLVLGDIVGQSGLKALVDRLPVLVAEWRLDAAVVNGENAAGGFGITAEICRDILEAGADAVTLGNHAFDKGEVLSFIDGEPRLIRPANFPLGTPGRGATLVELRNDARLLVINVMGRVHMSPVLDDPFVALDRELQQAPLGRVADAIVVDVHCEATSEKQALGLHCAGRASLVVGTHTHVPTADYRILPGGTAYCTDVGMSGDYDSILGMKVEGPLARLRGGSTSLPTQPAQGEATLCGVAVEINSNGLAEAIWPVRIGGTLSPAVPAW